MKKAKQPAKKKPVVGQAPSRKVHFADGTQPPVAALQPVLQHGPASSTAALVDVSSESDDSPDQTEPIPLEILKSKYCLHCWKEWNRRAHHGIPDASDIRQLEAESQDMHQKIQNSVTKDSHGNEHRSDSYDRKVRLYNIIQWQLQRAKELRVAGFGTPLDLWIDHLTRSQMLSEDWTHDRVRQYIPSSRIEDNALPDHIPDTRPRYPGGLKQRGEIRKETRAGAEETLHDALDDNDHHAREDDWRARNGSPVLRQPDLDQEADTEDEAEAPSSNLGLEAARAALKDLRTKAIPRVVQAWRDHAKPLTLKDSNLQMNDYTKDIHEFKEPNSDDKPSLQAYRATANLAYSLESAHHLWTQRRITDEGFMRLMKDGFGQLATLREQMHIAGVKGLPPRHELHGSQKVFYKAPLQPFVIEHWMDAREAQSKQQYKYSADRPLGPMIDDPAHTPEQSSGVVDHGDHRQARMTREELMGENMQMDLLVEDD